MKIPSPGHTPVAAALAAVLSIFAAAPVVGQDYGNVGSQSMRAQRDARRTEQKGEKSDKADKKTQQEEPALYPKATRNQPDAKASADNLKALQKLQETYEAGQYPAAIAEADKITAGTNASPYDKSFAWQIAGTAAGQSDDDSKAAHYFEQALASNGLDNNNHYQVMYNLAVTQYQLKQYDHALTTLDRFLAETKSEQPEQLNLRGALLSELKRYDEASALYQKLLIKNPDNKSYLMNAVSAYQQADQYDKAAELLSQTQAKGALTDPNQYRALYVTYINSDQPERALKVIDDGIAKGIVKPSPELAKDYMVLGQKAYYAKDDATAIDMYTRAASMASDGEAALNLAKIYADGGKKSEAKAAAQQALDKGVKDTAAAKRLAGAGG